MNAKVEGRDTLRTSASVGGKQLTLDPIRLVPITLNIREVESAIPAGFQMQWGDVDVDGDKMELTAGAGMGNGWGTIRFRGKDYVWSITELAEAFLNAVNEEPAPEAVSVETT